MSSVRAKIKPRKTFDEHISWHNIKARLEHQTLRDLLLGSFTGLTSVFFYRYSMIRSEAPQKALLIDLDSLLLATIAFLLAAFCRYVGHMIYVHACPGRIQSHKDLDDLLKKAKDTLVIEADWPEINERQVEAWNEENQTGNWLRCSIGLSEALVVVFYIIGLCFFFGAVGKFLLHLGHP